MGANISGEDFAANDKEVFQSYRIPPKAYKKKNKVSKSFSDTSGPVSPASSEFGYVSSNRNDITQQRQSNDHPHHRHHHQHQQRFRSGSLSSGLNRSRRDRPISHPPSILYSNSSTSSLNLSIVNAAVAASSPSPTAFYPYSNGIVSAPLPMMVNGSRGVEKTGSVGKGSRTNSGYSIGSESFDMSHSVGSGLGRATYVNGKIVEMGIHGSNASAQAGNTPLYMHSNYTVQDFMSYQQQQQQQFLEQQQLEYKQMMLLQQQQQQLKQQQLFLLQQQQQQQQQQLHQDHSSVSLPIQDLSVQHQITGLVLQTKSRRPVRHPDRVTNSHNRNTSHSITIPSSSPQQQTPSSPTSPRHHHARSPGHSTAPQPHHYASSPPGSLTSSYNGGASSFSSTGSHFQTMLAMTSASPPSSSSSSLSNPGSDSTAPPTNYNNSGNNQYAQHHSSPVVPTTKTIANKFGHLLDELAAKILPPRRLLGGREYYPDKTLPYLLPCDEQEGERLLLQHYVIRYAFGSNIIAPIDTSIAGKVLDCGCGPGTWIMEMATEYEDLDFYGFDISPMYPSAIHPRNAHFSMGNLLDPEIPFASDSFLLVHQRNMLLGLTQDAWPGVIQDLYRCVIPGGQGWLQLSEVDPIWSRPGPVSRSVLKMLNETAQNRNVDVLLPQRLDQVLKDVGCENVKMIMVEIPIGPWGGKIGVLWRDVLKAEMDALKPVVLQAQLENAVASGQDIAVCGAEMTTSEEWEEMMAQVWAEMDQYHTFSRVYLAYGQKI
ncbi:hypothetical protein BG011_004064 [Mortierella polycephala]|uniref:Methyltransferase domain-containing protein n=1 Tax=Mortierella polycephala TaxID=41804 RepID=A0A9P6Q203_9FUNG|nr:hypothetical protein BG011_004064 [Mortierella polycephala]